MQIPLSYEDIRSRYPEKVEEAIQSLRASKVTSRLLPPEGLQWAIYASALCDGSYGYQFSDEVNNIAIRRAFNACIRLTLPRSPKSHKPPREFYSTEFSAETFPEEILQLYKERYAADREQVAKFARERGEEPPKVLGIPDLSVITCLCGQITQGPKLPNHEFAKAHGLGTYMNVRDGLTMIYLCPACHAKVVESLKGVRDVFGDLAKDIHFSNHLRD